MSFYLRLFCSCFIFCLPKGSWNRWRDTYSHHRDEIRGRSTRHQRRICQIISLLTGQVYIGESVFVVVVRSFLCLLVYCAQEYIPQWKSQSEILRKTDPQGRVPHCGSSLLGILRFVILQSSGHRTAVYSAFNEVLNSFLIVIFNLDFSCKFVSLHWTLFHWSGDGEAHSQCHAVTVMNSFVTFPSITFDFETEENFSFCFQDDTRGNYKKILLQLISEKKWTNIKLDLKIFTKRKREASLAVWLENIFLLPSRLINKARPGRILLSLKSTPL